jgi:simple sugar transport system ATP-binding protein
MSTMTTPTTPLLDVQNVSKYFGSVIALKDISMKVRAGEVMCLLGDNGAGKSTLIKILSGVHQPSEGHYLVEGKEVHFTSPRDALAAGIATVFQDLAMIPLMGISRNFFLGSEPTKGWGPFRHFDAPFANRVTRDELAKMGIEIRDTGQPVGTLSGGERQCVAIARAVYFGAKVLILDEPTAALGVKEAGVVLRYIAQARARNLGVIFITHNPHHAYPIGDHFTILNRGRSYGTFAKADISREELTGMMAGGEALEELSHELAEFARTDEKARSALAEVAKEFGATAETLHVEHLPPQFIEAERKYTGQLPSVDGESKQ